MKIIIEGKPRGKGRPRFTRSGIVYTDQQTKDYEKLVGISYQNCKDRKVYTNAIKMEIRAYFEPIKSISKKERDRLIGKSYTKKPDADNIAKIIMDGLNGIAYKDDSQVVELTVTKHYSEKEYVEVIINEKD